MKTSRVMLQPLSIGRETEFKIYLNRQNLQNGDEPFNVISLPNGVKCYDAELECGNGFVSKRVLFCLLDENSQHFYDMLSACIATQQLPESMLLKFGDKYPLSLFPSVFCHRQNVFITLGVEDQKINLKDLPVALAENTDSHCATCEYSIKCQSNQKTSLALSYFNKNICGVFAIDYLPENLITLSQLMSCVYESDRKKLGNTRLGYSAIENDISHFIDINAQSEVNIAQLVIYKLKLVKIVLEKFIQTNNENLNLESCFKYDNVYADAADIDSMYVGILPVSEKKSLKRATILQEIKQGSVRLLNRNEEVRIELKQDSNKKNTLHKDDKVSIILRAFDGEIHHIESRVHSVELDCLILKMENTTQKTALTQFFSNQDQDAYMSAKYFSMEDNLSFSEHLFLFFTSILFRNSVLGEDEIFHLKHVLFSSIKSDISSLSVNDVIELINSKSALSVVLRQENLLYKPSTDVSVKLSNYHWGNILLWILKLVHNMKDFSNINTERKLSLWLKECDSLSSLINELSICVDNRNSVIVGEINEAELLKLALGSMIDDKQWLESVLSKKPSKPSKPLENTRSFSSEFEDTLIMRQVVRTSYGEKEETNLEKKVGNEK